MYLYLTKTRIFQSIILLYGLVIFTLRGNNKNPIMFPKNVKTIKTIHFLRCNMHREPRTLL